MESSIERALAVDGTAIVSVRGEVDFANCDDVADGVREALTEWTPSLVQVDLREATFFDSTGLGALIEGYKACAETGARFVVINPSHAFRRVLDVTGLSDFFGLSEEAGEDAAAEQATQATGT
jgi:anti-sigma B factor antagonist